MKELSKNELKTLFESRDKTLYTKSGAFIFRKAIDGETILTIVSGRLETIKTAGRDERVVRNLMLGGSAETYIIPSDTFNKRYEITGTTYNIDGQVWTSCVPHGKVHAFEYTGEPIKFTAPWNEEMMCVWRATT